MAVLFKTFFSNQYFRISATQVISYFLGTGAVTGMDLRWGVFYIYESEPQNDGWIHNYDSKTDFLIPNFGNSLLKGHKKSDKIIMIFSQYFAKNYKINLKYHSSVITPKLLSLSPPKTNNKYFPFLCVWSSLYSVISQIWIQNENICYEKAKRFLISTFLLGCWDKKEKNEAKLVRNCQMINQWPVTKRKVY